MKVTRKQSLSPHCTHPNISLDPTQGSSWGIPCWWTKGDIHRVPGTIAKWNGECFVHRPLILDRKRRFCETVKRCEILHIIAKNEKTHHSQQLFTKQLLTSRHYDTRPPSESAPLMQISSTHLSGHQRKECHACFRRPSRWRRDHWCRRLRLRPGNQRQVGLN